MCQLGLWKVFIFVPHHPPQPARNMDSIDISTLRDIVLETQQTLPGSFRAVFQDDIQPDLVASIEAAVAHGIARQQQSQDHADVSPRADYDQLLHRLDDLKASLTDFKPTRTKMEQCLKDPPFISAVLVEPVTPLVTGEQQGTRDHQHVCIPTDNTGQQDAEEVLPSRPMTPMLIAKYNITFHDATSGG